MAIHNKLEVTVSSDGRVLPEYTAEPEVVEIHRAADGGNAPTIIKYIESTPGLDFAINFKLLKGIDFGEADQINFITYCDGQSMGGRAATRSQYELTGSLSLTRNSMKVQGDNTTTRRFYWKELTTTDEEPPTGSQGFEKYGQLGTIKVKVWRQKTYFRKESTHATTHKPPTLVEDPIPEKALKGRAIGATIGLGPALPVPGKTSKRTVHANVIDSGPLVIFVFLYRTKRDLQILGVIPRTPSPEPLERRDVNTLSVEELKELVGRQQAELTLSRQAVESRVKKERGSKVKTETASGDDNDTVISGMKREFQDEDDDIVFVRSQKKPHREPEILDLSG
ncbi:hypothetical protein PV08_11939 [Exophiala spinifera]|uniref:DUF7918 domain-containing protein n=1 Tax=Exophiala spinifera TaxID=91928 RepID=A0A0D2ASY2_9EURO|nr:uncharacterized protein PV08_11939 [Exophiala spinifera]KIW09838.1 hypothetical protein PV08_11939 [Exophiala spinifera]